MKSKWRSLTASSNFKNGQFQNLLPTPTIAEGVTYSRILADYFRKPVNVSPPSVLPSVKTNLNALGPAPQLVWFGHSSYLIHVGGINILVDPVFSGHASPFSNMIKAYPGSDVYKPADMPAIDIMIITHNHYDHLDKKTIAALKPKIKHVFTPLGVGKDLSDCGIDMGNITEMDWWDTEKITDEINLSATPSRHFSGRGLKRAGSLWASFVLQIKEMRIFIGGDSGYGPHFKTIGEKFGPFNIALLECGQYNAFWPNIHMMPEETVQAGIDLRASVLMPVHWGKFTLASHPWNESVSRFVAKATALEQLYATPLIGQVVEFGKKLPTDEWWKL